MIFGNNGGGGRFGNNQSVNTGIHTYYCDTYSLSIGCWDDKFSIKFMPALGTNERGMVTYDKDKRISTSLSLVKAGVLVKKYKKKLLPMLLDNAEKESVSFGVPIRSSNAGNCVLGIEYSKDETTGEYSSYLVFARNIENGVCAPEFLIKYKFNKVESVENFDLSKGTGETVMEEGEIFDFIKILEERMLMTGLSSHAKRYSDSFKKNSDGVAPSSSAPQMDFDPTAGFSQFE